jgi:hypothetical protein
MLTRASASPQSFPSAAMQDMETDYVPGFAIVGCKYV